MPEHPLNQDITIGVPDEKSMESSVTISLADIINQALQKSCPSKGPSTTADIVKKIWNSIFSRLHSRSLLNQTLIVDLDGLDQLSETLDEDVQKILVAYP